MWELNFIVLIYSHLTIIAVFGVEPQLPANKSFCYVTDTDSSVSYNFTKLMRPSEDITITHDYPNETLRIQLCSPLKKPCNGKDGYGICLIKGKTEKGIGIMSPKVLSEPGRVLFIFSGDKCTSDINYTVTIIMKCDYSATGFTHPEIIPHTEEQCNLHLIWKTAHACHEAIETDCKVEKNGLHYDLSPLIGYRDNYVVQTGDAKAPKIILNVCHSVIFEYGALCHKNSGACLHSTKNSTDEFLNLGEVQKPPFIENNQLKIVYDYGAICKLRQVSEPHVKTTISFICDYEAVDTFPEYVRGSEECHYQLIWKTAAACSIESLQNRSAISGSSCSVVNPITNFTYNLKALMNKEYYATAKSGNKYKFGVCSPLTKTSCQSGSGACLEKNGISTGKANANLTWQEGGPYLNYTNGDSCGNGQRHYTVIAFMCGPEASSNIPVVMEEYPCQLIINWNTDLVCERRIKCATDNDEINLSSLIKHNDNYVIKGNSIAFELNICRPLVPLQGFTCAHGSAVCKAAISSTNEYVNETSLGFPLENPMIDDKQQVVLRYLGGSSCRESPNTMISTNITFPCHYGTKGSPKFKDYQDCTYIFEWQTSVTCKAEIGHWAQPCIVRDQQAHEYNLSMLHDENKVYHIQNEYKKEYSVSICEGQKGCNGSAICLGTNGFGTLANIIFYYDRDAVKLEYMNGSKCVNGSSTSEVQLICEESAGVGRPILLWESACSVAIEWRTNVTCSPQSQTEKPTEPSEKQEIVARFSPSLSDIVAAVLVMAAALAGAVFYFRDPNRRTQLRSCLSSFSTKKNTGRVQYSRVNTTEEAWLLLDADATQCQTDSDDDLLNA